MTRRTRRVATRATLCAAMTLVAALPATAGAQSTSDLVDFNLTESVTTWPSEYHFSSTGNGIAAFRWLDSPSKTTVISANACSDLALYGTSTYSVSDTSYHNLFAGGTGVCFKVRGRTSIGSGAMTNYDGRVQR
jgi:hypothetical protein